MTMPRVAVLAAAFVIAFGAPARAQQKGVFWVLLKERAEVQGTPMRLSDVADVGSLDKALGEALSRIEIGPTPQPGKSLLLTRKSLKAIVARHPRVKGLQFAIRGAQAVSVQPKTISLSGSELLAIARRHLARKLEGASDAKILPRTAPEGLTVLAGRYSTRFDVRHQKGNLPFAGPTRMQIVAVVDGNDYAVRKVDLSVRRRAKVLIAGSIINRGKTMKPDQVLTVEREINHDTGEIITDPAQLEGLIAKGRIEKGQLLRRQDFRTPPVVFKNAPVIIELISGSLKIRSEGTALGNAAVGELVAVRTGKRRRVVRCTVIDSRTVRMVMAKGGKKR